MSAKIRVLCLNPNTSTEFTVKIGDCISQFLKEKQLNERIAITVVSPQAGPASIESMYDEVLSCAPSLKYIIQNKDKFDGVVIACFSDHPLVYCCREILDVPVVGIMDSSLYSACLVGHRFSIVTTNKQWESLLLPGVERLGLKSQCASIRSCDLPVLALEHSENDVTQKIIHESEVAVQKDGADVIVLGCAGMVGLAQQFKNNPLRGRNPIYFPILLRLSSGNLFLIQTAKV
eukprot:5355_1